MSQTLQRPMTREAFLEWEERQPGRYEFDGISVRARTGGSVGRARVQRNLLAALALPEADLSIPLANLYAGVELVVDTAEPEA